MFFSYLKFVLPVLFLSLAVSKANALSDFNTFIRAIKVHNTYEVKRWLALKPDFINQSGERGNTPLIIAAKRGYIEIVNILLAVDADPDLANNHDYTPLMEAAKKGHAIVVRRLIKAGADRYLENRHGYTALLEAAKQGHTHVAQILIEAGAAKGQNMNCIRALLHKPDDWLDDEIYLLTNQAS